MRMRCRVCKLPWLAYGSHTVNPCPFCGKRDLMGFFE